MRIFISKLLGRLATGALGLSAAASFACGAGHVVYRGQNPYVRYGNYPQRQVIVQPRPVDDGGQPLSNQQFGPGTATRIGPDGRPIFSGGQQFGPQGSGFASQQQFGSGGPPNGQQGRQFGPQGPQFGSQDPGFGGPQNQNFGPQGGQFGPQGQGFAGQNPRFAGPQGQQFGPEQGPQGQQFGPEQFGPEGQQFGPPQGFDPRSAGGPQGEPQFGPQGQGFVPNQQFGPQGPEQFRSQGQQPGGPQGQGFIPQNQLGPQGQQFGMQGLSFGPDGKPIGRPPIQNQGNPGGPGPGVNPQDPQFTPPGFQGAINGPRGNQPPGPQGPPANDPVLSQLTKAPGDASVEGTCPVTGAKLGSMGPPVKVDVNGREVVVCCESCKAKLLAEPDAYLTDAGK